MSSMPRRGGRLDEIDVLRGLAALAVVVFHYSGHSRRYFAGFPFHLEYGKYGVQLFFVISGFFIFRTIEGCRSAHEFLLLRFSRLYPVYWATLAMLLAFDVIDGGAGVWIANYLLNATMLQSFVGFPDVDIVYWSLAVEMVFYLLMAALLASRAIRRPLAVALVWLALANLWPRVQDHPAAQSAVVRTLAGVLVHGPFFIAGMMFHLMHKSAGRRLAGPLGIVLLCVLASWANSGGVMATVAAVAFSLVALAVSGRLGFLVSPVTVWLGAISYSLYLVHRNIGYAALFKLNALGVDSRLAFVLVIGGALALASAFTYWIERPSLRVLRRWVKGSRTTGAAMVNP